MGRCERTEGKSATGAFASRTVCAVSGTNGGNKQSADDLRFQALIISSAYPGTSRAVGAITSRCVISVQTLLPLKRETKLKEK